MEPSLDKHSGARYQLWVDLLVWEPWLEKHWGVLGGLVTSPGALVGQMIWSPVSVVGWVTSLGALVGTNDLEPWKVWVETNVVMVLWFLTMRWSHSLMSWGGLASRNPSLVLIELLYEIPYSCLEYGTWVIGWKKDWVLPIYGRVVRGSQKPGFIFHMLISNHFLLY